MIIDFAKSPDWGRNGHGTSVLLSVDSILVLEKKVIKFYKKTGTQFNITCGYKLSLCVYLSF